MLEWFGSNQMMANSEKFQCMLLGMHKPLKIEIERYKLESAKSVKRLGLTIDTHVWHLIRIYWIFSR